MRWLLFVALAACADSPDAGTLSFSSLDDTTITRLVAVASGGEVSGAIYRITNINHGSTCPRVELDGPVVTLTGGGCTNADRATYDGVARIANHWWSEDGDEARYELEQFTISQGTRRTVYDGTAHGIAGPHARLDAELLVEESEHLVRSTLRKRCDGEVCRVQGTLDLDDNGSVNFDGEWRLEGWDVEITLRGIERINVRHELMYGAYNCVIWRLAGTERFGGWCER